MILNDANARKFIKISIITIVALVLLYLSYLFLDILIMLAVSLLISLILHPVVTILENHGIDRFSAVLITIFIITVIFVYGLSFLVPQITDQVVSISQSIQQTDIKSTFRSIDRAVVKYVPFIKAGTISTKLDAYITSNITGFLDSLSYFVSSIVGLIAVSVIVPFMTFFLLRDNKRIIKGMLNIMPNRYFEMSYSVIRCISIQLGRFVRGWILDAFLVGLLSMIGLTILGVDNSVPIGIVAGVGHLIPYFGPIIGGIPAIIISAAQLGNFSMVPSIVLMFILVYTIDNGLIQPNVFSKSVDMHPLIIIILIVAGSQVGIIGMLLAVPTATVIKTAAKEIYVGYKNYSIFKI